MCELVITLLGPPGAGKGTLAQLCADKLGFAVLSTGALCRWHTAEKTEIGKKIADVTKQGGLIPDELVTDMVLEWLPGPLRDHERILLDGYPRTRGQAASLLSYLEKEGLKDKFLVVVLDVSEDSLVRRLSNRLVCSNKDCQAVYSLLVKPPLKPGVCDECGSALRRRPDDNPEAIRERMRLYASHRDDLLSFYRDVKTCRVETLDVGDKTIPQAFWAFEQLIQRA